MTLTDFRKLVRFLSKDKKDLFVRLIGDDATDHPQFIELMDIFKKNKISFILGTDGLFHRSKLVAITELMALGYLKILSLDSNFILNKEQKKVLDFNLKNLRKGLHSSRYNLYCSLTIDQAYNKKKFQNIISYCKKAKFKVIRLLLDLPRSKEFFINNKKAGRFILSIINEIVNSEILVVLGCFLFPCMFSSPKKYLEVLSRISNNSSLCSSENLQLNILTDLSVNHCAALKNIQVKNIFDSKNIKEVYKKIAGKKKKYSGQLSLPEKCLKCDSGFKNLCNQICLSCN